MRLLRDGTGSGDTDQKGADGGRHLDVLGQARHQQDGAEDGKDDNLVGLMRDEVTEPGTSNG